MKGAHLYQSKLPVPLQKFRLQNEVESSGFLSKEHVILRRTVLAMALQHVKHL